MKQKIFLIGIFLIISCFTYSQKLLKGKVVSNINMLEDISIINLSNHETSKTIKNGYFSILAQANDTLVFSGVRVQGVQLTLKESDFYEDLFFVKLKSQINQLEEVWILSAKNSSLDAVKLGILSKPAKKYSPVERKINEATTGGGFLPLNLIINSLNGRTKTLKKELKIEKEQNLLNRLISFYEDNYYTDTLKIPTEYISGFQYYVISDQSVINSLTEKNKTMTSFLLGGLAERYLALISSGNN